MREQTRDMDRGGRGDDRGGGMMGDKARPHDRALALHHQRLKGEITMATTTHVLLQADVENLGTGGEVVKVRPGFARNFLLPRGLAVPATTGNLARVEELKKAAAARKSQEIAAAQELAKKLEGSSVKIARSFGDEGKMYGSVTSKDILEAFEKTGLSFDRKQIQLAEPIKTLGTVEVPLKLHSTVSINLKVEVVKK